VVETSEIAPPPIVIIGAGAAGLMAAIHAAGGPRPVLLLEGSDRPGQKILISGGGRCNVLPARAAAGDFVSDGSPNLVRKILAAWPLAEVRRFFEADLGVPLKVEAETGKLFPTSDRARTVLDALLAAVTQRGVRLRLGARVAGLARAGDGWRVRLADGETIGAGRVILATGGLSLPAMGSDGVHDGLRMAQALGHTLVPPYPALVPLAGNNPAHRALAGISLPVTMWAEEQAPRQVGDSGPRRPVIARSAGGFLFTHRGYSGPAVLNIAHVATRALQEGAADGLNRPPIFVQWTPLDAAAWDARLREDRRPLLSLLREHLPERLAACLLAEAGLAEAEAGQMRRADRQGLAALLTRYPLPYTGHEGYKTAEVTGGGVPLTVVNPATLESRIAPGLYLCGELLDAFGPIGGYNFLWAWVTGRAAGLAARG
jgi:predicted Rossmann fold flavoprotein